MPIESGQGIPEDVAAAFNVAELRVLSDHPRRGLMFNLLVHPFVELYRQGQFETDPQVLAQNIAVELSPQSLEMVGPYLPAIAQAQSLRRRYFIEIAEQAAMHSGFWRQTDFDTPIESETLLREINQGSITQETQVYEYLLEQATYVRNMVETYGDRQHGRENYLEKYQIDEELLPDAPEIIVDMKQLYLALRKILNQRQPIVEPLIEAARRLVEDQKKQAEREALKMPQLDQMTLTSEQRALLEPFESLIRLPSEYRLTHEQAIITSAAADESESTQFFRDIQDRVATALPDGLIFLLQSGKVTHQDNILHYLDNMRSGMFQVIQPFMVSENEDAVLPNTPEHIKALFELMMRIIYVLEESDF